MKTKRPCKRASGKIRRCNSAAPVLRKLQIDNGVSSQTMVFKIGLGDNGQKYAYKGAKRLFSIVSTPRWIHNRRNGTLLACEVDLPILPGRQRHV